MLNITRSYMYKQLMQQLVRSLEIRVKTTQTIKKQTENYEHTNLYKTLAVIILLFIELGLM